MNNIFFKPTPLYKEFMILDLIEKNKDITQREIGDFIGVAVSMINQYLDEYESNGLIKRKYQSKKTVDYFVTKKGSERRKLLNIWYLMSSQKIYNLAKHNITTFLNQIIEKGYKKILLYGAGEVAEIILDVIQNDRVIDLDVLAVIDDDVKRQNFYITNLPIISKKGIYLYECDGILISSYKHREKIKENLAEINFPLEKILEFFE